MDNRASLGSGSVNDIMTNWIAEHPQLISYLVLEEAYSYEDDDIPLDFLKKRSKKHQKIITILKEKYNSHVSLLTPVRLTPKKAKTFLSPYLNCKYSYVKYKIENLKHKQFETYSKNVAELLMFFGDDIFTKGAPKNNQYIFIPENMIFSFDIKSFENDSFQETNKMKSLYYLAKSFEALNVKVINNFNQLARSKSAQKQIILKIIQSLTKIYDDVLSYFPLNPLDSEFERFFFSPFFPFKRDFSEIFHKYQFSSPTDTISSILDLSYKIIRYYNLQEAPTDSILFLLIFRILYDELYARNILPFFSPPKIDEKQRSDQNESQNGKTESKNMNKKSCKKADSSNKNESQSEIEENSNNEDEENESKSKSTSNENENRNSNEKDSENENRSSNNDEKGSKNDNNDENRHNSHKPRLFDFLSALTFATMEPPDDSKLISDPNYAPRNNVSFVISHDDRFASSIDSLMPIVFSTNPLDALNCIRLSLLCVEKTAMLCFELKDIACLIPFDKVFSIFLYIVTGSGLEELFECYAPFLQACIPEKLLSLQFQFALTKITAADSHLRGLMAKKATEAKKSDHSNLNDPE